jgi:hypothetical protein
MALFTTIDVPCPACATPVSFKAAGSVNVDRAPALRRAILDGQFQRAACTKCGNEFRYAPEFAYLDTERRQWIAAYPLDRMRRWSGEERHARELFDRVYGPSAIEPLRRIGGMLEPRMTFGWAALREKLLIADRALDDATVELCKAAVLRASIAVPLSAEIELRLVDADDASLTMVWMRSAFELPGEAMRVSRRLYDEIAEDAREDWATLRGELLTQGMFVDLSRLLLEPDEESVAGA